MAMMMMMTMVMMMMMMKLVMTMSMFLTLMITTTMMMMTRCSPSGEKAVDSISSPASWLQILMMKMIISWMMIVMILRMMMSIAVISVYKTLSLLHEDAKSKNLSSKLWLEISYMKSFMILSEINICYMGEGYSRVTQLDFFCHCFKHIPSKRPSLFPLNDQA